MKKLIFILLLVFIASCEEYHSFDFNATSNADCMSKCEDYMHTYMCNEAVPAFHETIINGEFQLGLCSCFIRVCYK